MCFARSRPERGCDSGKDGQAIRMINDPGDTIVEEGRTTAERRRLPGR